MAATTGWSTGAAAVSTGSDTGSTASRRGAAACRAGTTSGAAACTTGVTTGVRAGPAMSATGSTTAAATSAAAGATTAAAGCDHRRDRGDHRRELLQNGSDDGSEDLGGTADGLGDPRRSGRHHLGNHRNGIRLDLRDERSGTGPARGDRGGRGGHAGRCSALDRHRQGGGARRGNRPGTWRGDGRVSGRALLPRGVVGDGPQQAGAVHDVTTAHRAVRGAGPDQRALALELPGSVVVELAGGQRTADAGGGQQRGTEDGAGDDQAAGAQRRLAGLATAAGNRDGHPIRVRLGLGRSTAGLGRHRGCVHRQRRTALAAQQVADEHRRRPGGEAVGRGRHRAQPPAQLGDAHRHVGSFVAPRGCHCADPLPNPD